MEKGTITEGMQLLENHKKAEIIYKQTYDIYMDWYYKNMPKNATRKYEIEKFITDNFLPLAAIISLSAGFIIGYLLGK